ncbi:hypothetical protein BpHYR1_034635 [Brachionus plicatilis]|uniref:Uncharacterized protein n=1 Tax=Brachionus plicatilis TaxID=10195 RepID=A0A3M7R5Z6_BRAPC|nr:hypothetical protein BpHYR1_034635 [Brachionus plicatilis]
MIKRHAEWLLTKINNFLIRTCLEYSEEPERIMYFTQTINLPRKNSSTNNYELNDLAKKLELAIKI